jgi:hypothetical protein
LILKSRFESQSVLLHRLSDWFKIEHQQSSCSYLQIQQRYTVVPWWELVLIAQGTAIAMRIYSQWNWGHFHLSARKLVPYPINSPILRFLHSWFFSLFEEDQFYSFCKKIDKYFRAGPQAILNDSYSDIHSRCRH